MVGVSVPAEGVIDRHHLGLVATNEPYQPAGCLKKVCLPESALVIVGLGSHHSRIAIAQELVMLDSQQVKCISHFQGPDFAQALPDRFGIVVVVDLPLCAIGCGHHHHLLARLRVAGENPARPDHLIIGVGVEGKEPRHQIASS
jgi:hypothetical protein